MGLVITASVLIRGLDAAWDRLVVSKICIGNDNGSLAGCYRKK